MSKKATESAATSSTRTFKALPGMEGAGVTFIRPSKLAEAGTTGVIVEGLYVGSKPNQFDNNKLDYEFETEDGKSVVLNGSGNLNYKMKQIPVNSFLQISYLGKSKITKGRMAGKEAHNFDVKISE